MAVRKDNIELVWSISELSSLFGKRTNIDGFLQDVVDHIAEHMQSDVCSIYLLDESGRRLVLRANRGLDPDAVGRVHLSLGEGITGTAVKELRPIREAHASRSPRYKFIPNTREEEYQSFLAVPIRHGLNRIGALVVQHRRPDQFTRHDTRALQTIAGQLAATLENVEMLMELHTRSDSDEVPAARRSESIRCHVASEGIAVGRIVHLHAHDLLAEHDSPDTGDQEAAFRAALERTDSQIETIHRDLDERISDLANLIFSSHLLMLRDQEFSGEMIRLIREGSTAHESVRQVVHRYVNLLAASSNPRTREKVHDIRDLGQRLVRNLKGGEEAHGDLRARVVIAHEMYPSDLVRLAAQHAEGLVLTGGGNTAHLTILARSLEIPSVLLRARREDELPEGELVAVDAYEGIIHRNPHQTLLDQFQTTQAARQTDRPGHAPSPAPTADGVEVELLANVNILHDVELAVRAGAMGIGLYRSEFPFLVRNDFPSEAEQYRIYRRIVERAEEGPVVLRTLDVGGDKLFGDREYQESNPFLGLRGIRFSLAHPELFDDQLRAILRAGADRDLRILFPMVASLDEFLRARERVRDVSADLADEGLEHHRHPKLGVMIELPSAVECCDEFAREADFLSIGSNDLVMYLLAVDRSNEQVERLYNPYHPAVLRALCRVIKTARRHGTHVSMCGEIGSSPLMIRFLIGCGLRSISADPARLSRIRDEIRSVTTTKSQEFSAELLRQPSVGDVQRVIAESGL